MPRSSSILLGTAFVASVAVLAWLGVTGRVSLPLVDKEPPPPDASYEAARAKIESDRQNLAKRLQTAANASERQKVLREAHVALSTGIAKHLAPWWKGTPWDFNGITQVPGQGKIACGYYVSTLLQHAGLQVERARLGQQASLHIIQTLIGQDALVKGHSMPVEQFVQRIRERGTGLYVVGLDHHTGFIWNDGNEVWFMHADAQCVVKERAVYSYALRSSDYRAAGHLSGHPALAEAWLKGTKLATKVPQHASHMDCGSLLPLSDPQPAVDHRSFVEAALAGLRPSHSAPTAGLNTTPQPLCNTGRPSVDL